MLKAMLLQRPPQRGERLFSRHAGDCRPINQSVSNSLFIYSTPVDFRLTPCALVRYDAVYTVLMDSTYRRPARAESQDSMSTTTTTQNRTGLRSLDRLGRHSAVSNIYRDSDGLWVELHPGWTSNPWDAHDIHEHTVRAVLDAARAIQRCDCAECGSGR